MRPHCPAAVASRFLMYSSLQYHARWIGSALLTTQHGNAVDVDHRMSELMQDRKLQITVDIETAFIDFTGVKISDTLWWRRTAVRHLEQ